MYEMILRWSSSGKLSKVGGSSLFDCTEAAMLAVVIDIVSGRSWTKKRERVRHSTNSFAAASTALPLEDLHALIIALVLVIATY
jgi:hypothetical protein